MTTETPHVEVRTRPVGPFQMNAYVLVDPTTRSSVLIDPGADPSTLHQMLDGTNPVAILLTHTHSDHVGALDAMRRALTVPLMAHPGPRDRGLQPDADRWVNDQDTIEVGHVVLTAQHTPGHSTDMLTFMTGSDATGFVAIVGDTIFDGGPGKTWAPEAFQTTLQTLRQRVLTWTDDTMCYPGHGPAFRLGDRRAAIEAFVNTDHGPFSGDATWDMGQSS